MGKASPTVFKINRGGRIIKVAVHGDDMACAGTPSDLAWLRKEVAKRFEIKVCTSTPVE